MSTHFWDGQLWQKVLYTGSFRATDYTALDGTRCLSDQHAEAFVYMYRATKVNHHCIVLSHAFSVHAKEGTITVQVICRAFVALGIAVPSGPASRKENAVRRIVSPQSGQ